MFENPAIPADILTVLFIALALLLVWLASRRMVARWVKRREPVEPGTFDFYTERKKKRTG